jgi:hypothetical protein
LAGDGFKPATVVGAGGADKICLAAKIIFGPQPIPVALGAQPPMNPESESAFDCGLLKKALPGTAVLMKSDIPESRSLTQPALPPM